MFMYKEDKRMSDFDFLRKADFIQWQYHNRYIDYTTYLDKMNELLESYREYRKKEEEKDATI